PYHPLIDPCTSYKSIDNPYRSSKYKLKSGEVALCDDRLNDGNKIPCPKGQVGIVPNCTVSTIVDFPFGLVPVPTITYQDNPIDPVTMLCKFQFFPWKNVSFAVEWFTDGYSVKNETICSGEDDNGCAKRHSELPTMDKQGRTHFQAGHRVRCKLRMKYNTNRLNKWTTLRRDSNEYFIGIEVTSSNHGRLKECKKDTKITVTFRPTVPVVGVNQKFIAIDIFVPSKGLQGQQTTSAVTTCDLKLPHGMFPNQNRSIEITAICDNLDQNDGTMDYHFVITSTNHPFWGVYTLPSLRIIVDNTPQQECQSVTDPHYATFDGRYYNFFETGDHVLYRNTYTDTEVHTRTWVCVYWTPSVTCNCGAAIREGADIIIFTVCNQHLVQQPKLLKTEVRSAKGLAPGTHIIRTVEGSKVTHNVILPSGTRVRVERYDWGLSVYVKAFNVQPNSIYGLCGNFNGRQDDEFQNGGDKKQHTDGDSFGKSWRVPHSKSYFEIFLPTPTLSPGQKNLRWCVCPKKSQQSDKFKKKCEWDSNIFEEYHKIPGIDIAKQFQGKRRRRSIEKTPYSDDIMDYEDKSFFVDELDAGFAFTRIRARRAVGKDLMSKENSTLYCKGIIEDTTAGKACSKVPGFNMTVAVTQCATDLQLTGDLKFAAAAFDSMKESCEEVALKNVSLYKKDANGELKPPAEIGENLCPSDCSNHGNCTNRTCICEEGYTSNDCSMSLNAVPELLGIYDGGLCDIRRRPCKKTDIFGREFINSENLTCHIRELKVSACQLLLDHAHACTGMS
ncbi:hypothetical protein QZH41_017750, partial [Actinostola sp. cb2023]